MIIKVEGSATPAEIALGRTQSNRVALSQTNPIGRKFLWNSARFRNTFP